MKYISKKMKHDSICLDKINYDDFKKIYEYDYKHLNGVWFDKDEYIKNSIDDINKLFNIIVNAQKSFSWLIYNDNIPVRNYMC